MESCTTEIESSRIQLPPCPPRPDRASHGWLVTLDLDVVAMHLHKRDDKRHNRLTAQAFLTIPRSPFAETKTFGTLYTEADPVALLMDDEIIRIRECPLRQRRMESVEGFRNKSPYRKMIQPKK